MRYLSLRQSGAVSRMTFILPGSLTSVGPPIRETTNTCELNNTSAPDEIATWIGDLPLESISCFLVMEQLHADVLRYEHSVPQDRIHLLGEFDPRSRGREIEDPFGQSNAVYQKQYDLIRDCIVNYLDSTMTGP
jgi:protein-tyrosine-phosphatase